MQTCEGCAQISVTYINQYTWAKGQPVETLTVALQGRFCLRAARAEIPQTTEEVAALVTTVIEDRRSKGQHRICRVSYPHLLRRQ